MATSATSRIKQDTLPQPTLSLACELGQNTWKLGFTIGVAQPPRERTIPARDIARVQQEIAQAKRRFGLPEDARSYPDRICANYLTNLLFCQSLFPDSL